MAISQCWESPKRVNPGVVAVDSLFLSVETSNLVMTCYEVQMNYEPFE